MQVDIVGRIRNLQLPVTQPLIPLFECLVNSIESIEDSGIKGGRIDVYFDRDARQIALTGTEETMLTSIRDVTIEDNGTGFNDGNVKAFFLSDSIRRCPPFVFHALRSPFSTHNCRYAGTPQEPSPLDGLSGWDQKSYLQL